MLEDYVWAFKKLHANNYSLKKTEFPVTLQLSVYICMFH